MLDRRQFTLAAAATLTATSPDGARADGRVTSGDVSIFYRQFGRPDYQPVILIPRHHEPDEVYEYFRAADFCLVSSLHDGMNLVAKEFVAARDDAARAAALRAAS